jgi:hypothetical protein
VKLLSPKTLTTTRAFLITVAVLCVFSTYAQIAWASSSQPVPVSMSSAESMKILTPATSNITLLSLKGGQYDVGVNTFANRNELVFIPLNVTTYSMSVNVSSNSANYAFISTNLPAKAEVWSQNVTGTGNLILNITISVVPATTSSSSWNPLFGFTGFTLGGITISATDVLAIFTALAIVLIGIGMKFSHNLLYFGMFLLSILGAVVVGIFVVGIAVGTYLLTFLIVKSYFGSRRRKS